MSHQYAGGMPGAGSSSGGRDASLAIGRPGEPSAASTIDLPDGNEGDVIYFSADGVKNGHTVQYRDGTTPITTALTAAKRHLVVCLFLDGTWRANAYVSP